MKITKYQHQTQYYETDQMRIIHHSNYIRWFEEARTDYLAQLGLPYTEMENNQVGIPVLAVSCQYKSMTRFGDTVEIEVAVTKYNGIKMNIEYVVCDKITGAVRCTGETSHCFMSSTGELVSIKKSYPAWHEVFQKMLTTA